MKKRIFSLFMVFSLCFVNVNQVYADAGSLIIAGGSVATIGAGAIAGPAVVAVFCAMMAFGMNVELTQASEEAGMTKTEFLKNKIQEYCNEAQISATTFNNYVLDQAQVLQNGAISITDKAGQTIEKFCNWLFESESVNNPTTGITSSVNVNGLTCPVIQPHGTYTFGTYKGGDVITIYNQGTKPLAIVTYKYRLNNNPNDVYTDINAFTKDSSTFENFSITLQNPDVTKTRTTYNFYNNGVYGVNLGGLNNYYTISLDLPLYDDYIGSSATDIFNHFSNTISDLEFGSNVNQDSITGNMDDYDLSKHVLNPTQDQTIVINPNITIPVPQDKDVTIDVNEYLDVVQDMIDGLRDDLITAIDDATDVPITIEFDPTQDWDPTIEKEDDTDLPPDDEKTPVIKDDILPHDFDPDPMKFDLKGIFPFCIPWDVKDMLSKLSADPVAPSYTINWMIPIINQRLVFTVDLSPFNGVAQVCRTMELLAFCIGLAVVTRQLFLRG